MTNYTALATEALTHEGIETYFGPLTQTRIDELGGTSNLIDILAKVLEKHGVQPADNNSWVAPDSIANEARAEALHQLQPPMILANIEHELGVENSHLDQVELNQLTANLLTARFTKKERIAAATQWEDVNGTGDRDDDLHDTDTPYGKIDAVLRDAADQFALERGYVDSTSLTFVNVVPVFEASVD